MPTCPTCKESIISQTPSLIGQTQCTTDCPEDITCEDIIPSNCVFYSGSQLICPSGNTSVDYGDTITVALGKMYDLICQNSTSCTVAVTPDDTCCGYLGNSGLPAGSQGNKIRSQSLSINIAGNDCQYLSIEEKPWSWTDASLQNGWTNASGFFAFQNAQYSNVKENIVRLRGAITKNSISGCTLQKIFTLPASRVPLRVRLFSINLILISNSCWRFSPAQIFIANDGTVNLLTGGGEFKNIIVSLDGISFETD